MSAIDRGVVATRVPTRRLWFPDWGSGMLPRLAAEECEDVVVGRLRVVGRRGPILWRLAPRQLAAYRRAERDHFVRARRADRQRVADLFFLRCEASGEPYLRVTPRRRYASVDLDLITCGRRRLSRLAEIAIAALLARETARGGRVDVGVWSGSDRIPCERADLVAARLWAIAMAPGGLVDAGIG